MSASQHLEGPVPPQHSGVEKNFHVHTKADSAEDAAAYFVTAKTRLLSVNEWGAYAGDASSDFKLTDEQGRVLTRQAKLQDYIRINIPGPADATGEGFDWVHIERLEYDIDADADTEAMHMRVRPCAPPHIPTEDVAHFFSDVSTSTFTVERVGKILNAYYHGRNEQPNTDVSGVANKLRNVIVATGAVLGGSRFQWKALLDGFLEF